MSNNNFFKYIFAIVVVFLIGYTVYIIFQNKDDFSDYNLDQTSTTNNIRTDLRFAISGFDTINPLLTNNRNVQEISKVIYDSLVTFKLLFILFISNNVFVENGILLRALFVLLFDDEL